MMLWKRKETTWLEATRLLIGMHAGTTTFFMCDGQGRDRRNTVIQCDDVLRKISDAIWIRHAYGSEWKLMLRSGNTSWTTWNEKNTTCLLRRWEFETADVSMTGNETFPRWGSDDSYLRDGLWLAFTYSRNMLDKLFQFSAELCFFRRAVQSRWMSSLIFGEFDISSDLARALYLLLTISSSLSLFLSFSLSIFLFVCFFSLSLFFSVPLCLICSSNKSYSFWY